MLVRGREEQIPASDSSGIKIHSVVMSLHADLSHSVTKILHSTRSIVFKTFPISVCKVMIQCDDCLGPVQWLYII